MVGFVLYQLYILHHSVEIQSHQHLLQAWFTPENYQSPKLFQRGESKGTFQVHGELTVVAEPCSAWFSLRLRAWIHGWWRELCCFRLRTFGGSRRLRVAVNHEFQWSSDSFNTCKVTCSSWKHKLGANGGNLVSNLAAQKGMCLKWDAFKSRLETNLLSIWHFSILGPRGPTCETRCMKHFHELSWLNVQTQRQTLAFLKKFKSQSFLGKDPFGKWSGSHAYLGAGMQSSELWGTVGWVNVIITWNRPEN